MLPGTLVETPELNELGNTITGRFCGWAKVMEESSSWEAAIVKIVFMGMGDWEEEYKLYDPEMITEIKEA